MIRSKLWFRCAAVHDPVSPVLVRPAVIGWEAKHRKVDLVIERPFNGEELVRRMKGWVTVNPQEVIDTVKRHGFIKLFDDSTVVVECDGSEEFEALEKAISDRFGGELTLEKV